MNEESKEEAQGGTIGGGIMKEESGRRNYEEESSGRQASERHLGGIWEARGHRRSRAGVGGKMYQNHCVFHCLSSRPAVSLGFWRGDPHEVM